MTGEKNRFKTTEKLWNLDDKQLKTPKHDALVLWLMDEDNLYNNLKGFKCERKNVRHNKNIFWRNITNEQVKEYDKDIMIRSEVPLTAQNGFVNGYADLIVTQIIESNEFGIVFVEFLIEVKPYIDSFGAVLRQLNSYKKFSRTNDCCLFTLDTRFDKQFESQGITVLHPPEDFDLDEYMKEMGLK